MSFLVYMKILVCPTEAIFSVFYSALLLITIGMASGDNEISFEENNANFAIDMLINLPGNEENIIFSPLSIQVCIGLARVGAIGQTADEITNAMRLQSNNVNDIGDSFRKFLDVFNNSKMVHIANKIYIKKGYKIHSGFMEIATKHFYSDAEEIDFSQNVKSANSMNNWVAIKTNHKITELISPENLNEDTRLVFLNALHFRGSWAKKFDVNRTKEDVFYLNENKAVKVQMMRKKDKFRYGELSDLDATTLEMPYENSELSMLILLPNEKTGLADLKKGLQTKSFKDIVSSMHDTEVLVKIPKFRSEYSINLQEPLEKLGIKRMFTDEAEFGNISESIEELKVSNVVHKAFIEVNEEGVEAAAATAGIVRTKRSLDIIEHAEFTADHPFIYAIMGTTNKQHQRVIFFLGSINKLREITSREKHEEL